MTEKRRFIDVWLVETNTVYKEVPFAVVTDWVQQGRVLETDMWKPSGTANWFPFGGGGGGEIDFGPYFPKPEVNRTEDRAEALEPVHVDFNYKKRHDDEDDEVDMIPLIDVSLVLLVFFMLSASAATVVATVVNKPEVPNALLTDNPDAFRIDVSNDAGAPIYSLAVAGAQPEKDEQEIRELGTLLLRLKARLERVPEGQPVEVVINADKDLPSYFLRDLLLALRTSPYREKITSNYFGASQKE